MIDTQMSRALERFLDLNAFRHGLIASNLANVDTPSFKTRDMNFAFELQKAESNLEYASVTPAVREVQGLIQRPDGNNVSLEREGLLMAETQLRFNAGVQLLRKEFARILLAIREGSTSG